MGSNFYARLSPAQRAKQPDAPEGVWPLDVEHGKGDVARTVGCGAVMDELQGYRVAYGLPPLPRPARTAEPWCAPADTDNWHSPDFPTTPVLA